MAFAGALAWRGWCRSGRDEDEALAALLDYAPRYAALFSRSPIDFSPSEGPADLRVMELAGV